MRFQFRFLVILCLVPTLGFAQTAGDAAADSGAVNAAPAAPLPVKHSPDGFPVLEDGTPIRLRLARTLSSAECKVGDRVDFTVVEPIILDGVAVVPQGGIAWGRISDAEHKRRMTRGGKLAVEITEVKLANAEKAKLRAVREAKGGGHTGVMGGAMVGTAIVVWPLAPVWLLMHGKEAKIPEGTEITAYVDGDRVYPVATTPAAPRAVAVPISASSPAVTQPAETPAPEMGAPDAAAPNATTPNGAGGEAAGPTAADSAAPEAAPTEAVPTDAAPVSTELTFTSSPDGAEIELDGAFVGNTPSTIGVPGGDHTIRMSKHGYQPYQKRLHTAGGTVTLHADLEAGGE
jgi:hypothetical protein